jgi:uncharacterized NAD(P)/FAD-binding protein YdhS
MVIVIGGGFSGAVTAAQIRRRAACRVILVERLGRPGRGLAYATPSHDLLLNVPAGKMSAFPDAPSHFADWLGPAVASEGTFAPRARYGDYLEAIVSASRVEVVAGEAVDLEATGSGAVVTLADGQRLRADAAVLALGNAPPRLLPELEPVADRPELVADPLASWSRVAPTDGTAVLVGTGLTALDVAVLLRTRGHRGKILAFSRHGLLPRPHRAPSPPALPGEPNVRRLAAWLRAHGGAVDSLRPITQDLWHRLGDGERRRFLRHARTFWDVHRHRAPPATHDAIARGVAEGWLEIRAARLRSVRPTQGRLRVELDRATVDASLLVNCTGPERDVTRQPGRLVAALLGRGLLCPDRLGLGVHTGPTGELLGADGRVVPRLHVVGPWRTADLWESTAVPELRVQAAQVALRIVEDLDVHSAGWSPAPLRTAGWSSLPTSSSSG